MRSALEAQSHHRNSSTCEKVGAGDSPGSSEGSETAALRGGGALVAQPGRSLRCHPLVKMLSARCPWTAGTATAMALNIRLEIHALPL